MVAGKSPSDSFGSITFCSIENLPCKLHLTPYSTRLAGVADCGCRKCLQKL